MRELLVFNVIFFKYLIDVYYYIDLFKNILCFYIEDILKIVYLVWWIFLNLFVVYVSLIYKFCLFIVMIKIKK